MIPSIGCVEWARARAGRPGARGGRDRRRDLKKLLFETARPRSFAFVRATRSRSSSPAPPNPQLRAYSSVTKQIASVLVVPTRHARAPKREASDGLRRSSPPPPPPPPPSPPPPKPNRQDGQGRCRWRRSRHGRKSSASRAAQCASCGDPMSARQPTQATSEALCLSARAPIAPRPPPPRLPSRWTGREGLQTPVATPGRARAGPPRVRERASSLPGSAPVTTLLPPAPLPAAAECVGRAPTDPRLLPPSLPPRKQKKTHTHIHLFGSPHHDSS
jgi:hypothetical protein